MIDQNRGPLKISIIVAVNHGQKTTGQRTTGQKPTENANPGRKTTRTKDHQDGFFLEKS